MPALIGSFIGRPPSNSEVKWAWAAVVTIVIVGIFSIYAFTTSSDEAPDQLPPRAELNIEQGVPPKLRTR